MRVLLRCILCAGCCLLAACQSQEQAPSGQATDATADETASIVAQKAVAGVGKKGQSLQGKEGVAKITATPLAAMANVEQKVQLEIKLTQALRLFQASEGRLPSSHQEFMDKIVKPNRIQLPELPPGAVYRFNVEKGELWVYPEDEVPED